MIYIQLDFLKNGDLRGSDVLSKNRVLGSMVVKRRSLKQNEGPRSGENRGHLCAGSSGTLQRLKLFFSILKCKI